jgi:hypothetical protein
MKKNNTGIEEIKKHMEQRRLEAEPRSYDDVVQTNVSSIASEPLVSSYVQTNKDVTPIQIPKNSISATESAKLAFQKLGEKYNCTFDNKYTK